jgi:hypothetical protein
VSLDGRRKGSRKQNVKSCDSVMDKEVPTSGKKTVCVQFTDSGKNEKKIKNRPLTEDSTSRVCLEGSSNNEEGSSESSRKKKWQGGKCKVRRTQTVTEESQFSRSTVETNKENKSESKQEHSRGGGKELPQELDNESAKLACQFLEKSCRDLIDVGEVLVLRARRCLEKKVSLKTMADPKNINKVVNSLQLLTELAGDNLQHVEGFLSLSHTHWVRGVAKHRTTKTGGDVDNEDKHKKIVTELDRVDGNTSLNGVGGDDVAHSLSENDSDDKKTENKEVVEGQSDIICGDSDQIREMRMDTSKKRKFKKELSDSDDREVVDNGENERNTHESVMKGKKRRRLEDGFGMEVDEVLVSGISNTVTDTGTSKNFKGDSECMMKGSSNQTVTELRDESGEDRVKDICADASENGGHSEVMKDNDRNKGLGEGSEEGEKGNINEKCVVNTGLLHETCDGLVQLQTDHDDDSTVLSEAGFESLSTIKLGSDERNSQKSVVSDISIDLEKSVVNVQETLQQNSYEKSDEEQEYKQLNAESEGNHTHPVMTDGELSAVDDDSKNDDIGDGGVIGGSSKSNDSDTLAVVDEGSKGDDSDVLTAVGEGSKSGDNDALTAVGEGSKGDDSDALSEVGEGSKGEASDALSELGDGNKDDDSDALSEVGEGSKGDASDALIAVGEDSKGNDSVALSEIGDGSKVDDSDALSEVGDGSKGDNSEALTAVDEGKNNEEDKNNSNSDADTIECMFTDAEEKSLNGEDHDDKNEKLTIADNLEAIKRNPEENEDGEVKINEDKPISLEESDNVTGDSVTTGHPIISVRNIKELLMEKYITDCNENNGEKNEVNTFEDLEDTGKKDEVNGSLEYDDKQGSSAVDKLKLSDNMSECEQEEKDDNTAADSTNKEGTSDALQYTAECVKAQQSVLAYSTDNEDTSSDTLPEKKKRKTRSRKTKQETAALKGTKPAKKKQCIGPKSQSREHSDTVSSSVSTDIDSECSTASKLAKPKESRKQKFRLKDTEAYKQDEKLHWKCTVLVERLRDEVFQKHYEGYCTDGEDGSEEKSKANNEIHRLEL